MILKAESMKTMGDVTITQTISVEQTERLSIYLLNDMLQMANGSYDKVLEVNESPKSNELKNIDFTKVPQLTENMSAG